MNKSALIKKVEDFDSLWTENLSKCDTSEADIEAATRSLLIIQREIDEAIHELPKFIFDNKECTFLPSSVMLEKRVLGDLRISQRPERIIFSKNNSNKGNPNMSRWRENLKYFLV